MCCCQMTLTRRSQDRWGLRQADQTDVAEPVFRRTVAEPPHGVQIDDWVDRLASSPVARA